MIMIDNNKHNNNNNNDEKKKKKHSKNQIKEIPRKQLFACFRFFFFLSNVLPCCGHWCKSITISAC